MPIAVASKTLMSSFDLYMTWRQRRNFSPTIKPSERISKLIPTTKFHKAQAYCHAKSTFQLVTGSIQVVMDALSTIFFVSPYFWNKAERFAPTSELQQTLVYLSMMSLVSLVLGLPESIYSTFVLEARFGFNKTTVRTFIIDHIKNLFLSAALGFPMVSILYYVLRVVLQYDPLIIATALWSFGSLLMVLMLWLFPNVIAPMFNTFTPMSDDSPLKGRVERIAASLNFPLSGIYVVDGSRRSSHSNAYIFGFFRKYICIYDTLLTQCAEAAKLNHEKDEQSAIIGRGANEQSNGTMTPAEDSDNAAKDNSDASDKGNKFEGGEDVVAVVCHELGHWKNGHLGKGVAKALVHTFVVCVLYGLTAGNQELFESFGFSSVSQPVIIGLILFSNMLSPLDDLMQPWHNYMSRKFEYEADGFAKKMDMAQPLGDALVRMTVDNLSNMNPDPLYSMWNYSHPTLLERLDALGVSPSMPIVELQKDANTNGTMVDESETSMLSKKDQ